MLNKQKLLQLAKGFGNDKVVKVVENLSEDYGLHYLSYDTEIAIKLGNSKLFENFKKYVDNVL